MYHKEYKAINANPAADFSLRAKQWRSIIRDEAGAL